MLIQEVSVIDAILSFVLRAPWRPPEESSPPGTGFTFFEVLIVILILGILSMMSLPLISSTLNATKLDAAVYDVVADLKYTRQLAARHQRDFSCEIDLSKNRVVVRDTRYKDDNSAHLDAEPPVEAYGMVFEPLTKAVYDRDFDNLSQYDGILITQAPTPAEITFAPLGHCGDADKVIQLSIGSDQRSITVDGPTGLVRVD